MSILGRKISGKAVAALAAVMIVGAMLPVMTSECPPMYLVPACMDRSTPCSMALKKYGVAQVLSTATRAPAARGPPGATAATTGS